MTEDPTHDARVESALRARRLVQLSTLTIVGLRGAIAHGEFERHYQRVVNIHTGQLVGAEALIRWQRPQHGLVAPGPFIATAEGIEDQATSDKRTELGCEQGQGYRFARPLPADAFAQQVLTRSALGAA